MDAEPAIVEAAENKMFHKLLWLISLLVLILLVVGGTAAFQIYFPKPQKNVSVWPEEVVGSFRAGDYQEAISSRLAIQDDPNTSPEAKAMAVYNSLGSEYRLTGNQNALLVDVQNMKKIILDQTLSLKIRAETLDVLAKEYAITGRNQAVFA
ncbi:MAG: hypothetical protein Athens041674_746, partial [Parcubacteria group bacterium Athens0416_74]